MFGFNKQKPAPQTCPGNPGIGVEAKISFASGNRTWNEQINLVNIAADVLRQKGYRVVNEKTWLHHTESGFMLLPQIVTMQPSEDGCVKTSTTIQINHPALAPEGIFEYQHSIGKDTATSVREGFAMWVQTDFVPLLEALLPTPQKCMALEMTIEAKDGKPERVRRAILGPVAHFMPERPATMAEDTSEDHSFCPCCLLTKSLETFVELMEGDRLYCLRLFASRDSEGVPSADCRVNGEDWEKGAQALRQYALTWPPAGFEFRKQYVVLQSIKKGSEPDAAADRSRN